MNFKKIIYAAVATLILSTTATAQDFRDSAGIQYNVSNGHAVVQNKGYTKQPLKGKVIIPTTAKYGGKTYNVVALEDMCFMKSEFVTEIVIPETVTDIGEMVFSECPVLETVVVGKNVEKFGPTPFYDTTTVKTIICHAATPPYLDSLEDLDLSILTLYVPAESVEAYKVAEGWSSVQNILPIE